VSWAGGAGTLLPVTTVRGWLVYVVRCREGSLYTGATNDLPRRLKAHNAGTGARYTRARRPVTLIWKRRAKDKSAALSLEARLKRLSRAEKLRFVTTPRARLPPRRS
jgi:putative endonuclease